jgi:flagellar basal body rod protein FlgG
MDNSTYVLLSHEQALRRRLDVAANNMANSETAGFRRERPVFREYIEQIGGPPARRAACPSARHRLRAGLSRDAGRARGRIPGDRQPARYHDRRAGLA